MRTQLLQEWENELLLGNVVLSEWATFLVQDADLAFCSGADIAALVTAQAAIETQLRHEAGHEQARGTFATVIDCSSLDKGTKTRLHEVRRYRNRWVHVNDPDEDAELLDGPDRARTELADMATKSMRLLYEVIFAFQGT